MFPCLFLEFFRVLYRYFFFSIFGLVDTKVRGCISSRVGVFGSLGLCVCVVFLFRCFFETPNRGKRTEIDTPFGRLFCRYVCFTHFERP